MAALTMTPAAVRQPFAPLDASRMRTLLRTKMNLQNKQNGAILSSKRQPLGESDAENIDPTAFKSTKRKRAADDEDDHVPVKSPMKPMKTSRPALSILVDSTSTSNTHTPTTPSKASHSTPKPASALKPAGRSPQMKASKAFSRRATISKSRPESASRKGVSRPFSIAAALSNGKSKSQAAPTTKMPASWSFDIYVDSEQEEMTNLMQHSTCVLDISDDEGKQEDRSDHRGKENIPPAELGIAVPRSRQQESPAAAARKSDMVDEPRSPLGDLNAADYYSEDCHAFSYAVVYDDDETDAPALAPEKKFAFTSLYRPTHPTRSKLSSMSSIASVLEAACPVKPTEAEIQPSDGGIEIWESESAAEEATGESEPATA
ncbi:hypothetical protein BJY01DRAFT_200846 [Aspergillus pseudoustus]|uniref:Uncharacterized protein n=1 Tax=Aspergillus pseudoustus TaxID=1810923 RepID=A0ABR4JRC4_9EURO